MATDSAIYRDDNIFQSLYVEDLFVGYPLTGNLYHFPRNDGTAGQVLTTDGNGHLSFVMAAGDVNGPGSSTNTAIARWNGTSGALLENSTSTLSNAGLLTTAGLVLGSLTYPTVDGTAGQAITTNGSGVLSLTTVVSGPGSSVDSTVVLFNGTSGEIIKDSTVSINGSGNITCQGLNTLTYPSADGTYGQVITTNGSAVLSLKSLLTNKTTGLMNTVTSTNIGVGDHIQFSIVQFSGLGITLDTTTSYVNTTNTASIGRFTLQGGHTYFLDAMVSIAAFSSSAGYITINWYNSDAGTSINTTTIPSTAGTTGVLYGCSAVGFAPSSNTRVEVRLTAVNLLTSISRSFAKIIQTS